MRLGTVRFYTYLPIALEEPRSDSSPHQWTSTAQVIKASFRSALRQHAQGLTTMNGISIDDGLGSDPWIFKRACWHRRAATVKEKTND